MGADVVALGEAAPGAGHQRAPHEPGMPPGRLEDRALQEDVLAAGERVRAPRAEDPLEGLGDRVLGRHRQHVARRALEHRHRRRGAGHRGQDRDRRGAAADDHDPPAGVVEALGPGLRVDDQPGEVLEAVELRRESLLVVEVAGAREEEAAGQLDALAVVAPLRGDGPARLVGRPPGAGDAMTEADVPAEVVLGDGLVQVVEDEVGPGDRLVRRPGLEGEPEGEQVGVRADAREAEQVPRATDRVASLEDREAPTGRAHGEVARGADARDPGADDQHIDVGARAVVRVRRRRRHRLSRSSAWRSNAIVAAGPARSKGRRTRDLSPPAGRQAAPARSATATRA